MRMALMGALGVILGCLSFASGEEQSGEQSPQGVIEDQQVPVASGGAIGAESGEKVAPGDEKDASHLVTIQKESVSLKEALKEIAVQFNLCMVESDGIVYLVRPEHAEDFMARQEGLVVEVYSLQNPGPLERQEIPRAFGSSKAGAGR